MPPPYQTSHHECLDLRIKRHNMNASIPVSNVRTRMLPRIKRHNMNATPYQTSKLYILTSSKMDLRPCDSTNTTQHRELDEIETIPYQEITC